MTDRDMRNIDILPNGHFRVRIEHRGEVLSGVFATYDEAVDLRDELKRKIVDGDLLPTKGATARDLGPRFLGSRLSNRSGDNDTSRWNHIKNAPWARKAAKSVTRADGLAWLKLLKRTRHRFDPKKHGDREPAFIGWQTRKHLLNLARAFFRWAMDQECYGVSSNPFVDLVVEREDGDEDAGYQEGWYLDVEHKEQARFLGMWNRTDIGLDEGDRMEKWIVQFAMGAGIRKGEQWCLHLDDVHVGANEKAPRVEIRFGSWDSVKKRYRAPKGRKGEKKSRTVFLHGLALEAARAWLAQLPIYAPKNPFGLMFPTERGARRTGNPRSWKKVVEALGVIPRIGRKVWWHLLRHTCASALVSGWWGMRWSLEDVCKVLGHTDVRTTQIYAHLAPSALQTVAARAQAAYAMTVPGPVMTRRPAARIEPQGPGIIQHARRDSDPRHSASKAWNSHHNLPEIERLDGRVTAIRHVLALVASGDLDASFEVVACLQQGLDKALAAYADAVARANGGAL